MMAALLLVAGCTHAVDGPVTWWHTLEGGPIADARPPPPGADAPYPNLSTVPARPSPIDPGLRVRTTGGLAADRASATYAAQLDPLTAPPARDRSGLFAAARPLPAADPNAAGAALDAAETPAPPVRLPPSPAPVAAAPVRHAATVPAADVVDTPLPDIAQDSGPPPPVPDAPPAPPVLAGVRIPATVPHLPPVRPVPTPVPQAGLNAVDRAPLPLAFAPGSAVLEAAAQGALHGVAGRRGDHAIEVIGFGESDSQDGQSQYAGVRLASERARAVAAALLGDGVPMSALRMSADAPGRGAAVRLVD